MDIVDIKNLLNTSPDEFIEVVDRLPRKELKQIVNFAYALNVANSRYQDASKKIWGNIIKVGD